MLYGLDLAKKAIARDRQAVVVEGYTDVMACHLAGVETAVATCGTAFGVDHIKVLRRHHARRGRRSRRPRWSSPSTATRPGRRPRMRAFGEDQRFVSQTFVAVEPNGHGPVRAAPEQRRRGGARAGRRRRCRCSSSPIRTTIGRFDLDTAEGRVQALRAAAPVVAGIRDRVAAPRVRPHRWPAGSASRSSRSPPRCTGRARRPGRADPPGRARASRAADGAAPTPGTGRTRRAAITRIASLVDSSCCEIASRCGRASRHSPRETWNCVSSRWPLHKSVGLAWQAATCRLISSPRSARLAHSISSRLIPRGLTRSRAGGCSKSSISPAREAGKTSDSKSWLISLGEAWCCFHDHRELPDS